MTFNTPYQLIPTPPVFDTFCESSKLKIKKPVKIGGVGYV